MTITKQRIGVVKGTFLAPGVSANKRLYSAETNIPAAVARMQARLADESAQPITMLTHHAAGDDSTKIAGRVTKVDLDENGVATWEADLADNTSGHEIAALVTPEQPYLQNVSIRGWWLGPVRTETVEGQSVETADDLEVDGIDFTKDPGVAAARIEQARLESGSNGESAKRHLIFESAAGVAVEVAETKPDDEMETSPAPVTSGGGTTYADPGYQSDKKPRYPLNSAKRVRSAWSYINNADNAGKYTSAQLKRIKGRIKTAAKKFNIDIAQETADLASKFTELLEAYASVNLDNGPAEIRVAGYMSDPSDLAAVGARLAAGALAALAAIDPDNDGDIDLPGDDDGIDVCPNCAVDLDDDANFCPNCGTAIQAESAPTSASSVGETQTTKETPVGTETNTAETDTKLAEWNALSDADKTAVAAFVAASAESAPEAGQLSEADRTAIAAKIVEQLGVKPAAADESKPEGSTTNGAATTPVASEEVIKAAVKEETDKLRKEIVETYGPRRRGVVVSEGIEPAKPLHEMSDEEFRAHTAKQFQGWAAAGR